MKIQQNIVSTFGAGFFAGLVVSGNLTDAEVMKLEYTDVDFCNQWKKFLRAYTSSEYDAEGLEAMFAAIREDFRSGLEEKLL